MQHRHRPATESRAEKAERPPPSWGLQNVPVSGIHCERSTWVGCLQLHDTTGLPEEEVARKVGAAWGRQLGAENAETCAGKVAAIATCCPQEIWRERTKVE